MLGVVNHTKDVNGDAMLPLSGRSEPTGAFRRQVFQRIPVAATTVPLPRADSTNQHCQAVPSALLRPTSTGTS